jgi:hypothetical protein
VQPGKTVTTGFDLSVSDGTDTVKNSGTKVIATATGPTLSGAYNPAINDNESVNQLKFLNVTDSRSAGSETATITLLDANGNPTDANGYWSGAGLTKVATGTYSLSAASPTAMTSALQALTFTPTDHQVVAGQSVKTKVALTITDGVGTGTMNAGTITASAENTVNANGKNVVIGSGGTYIMADGASLTGTISFAGSNAFLYVGGNSPPVATLSGFDLNGATGDEVILSGFSYVAGQDTVSLGANNVLTLNLDDTTQQILLNPLANYAGHSFSIQTNSLDQVVLIDPNSGTTTARMGFLAASTVPDKPVADAPFHENSMPFYDMFDGSFGSRLVSNGANTGIDNVPRSSVELGSAWIGSAVNHPFFPIPLHPS